MTSVVDLRDLKVTVVAGGWSGERPFNLQSGRSVLATLKRHGVAAEWMELGRDVRCLQTLIERPPEFAVLCLTEEVPIQGALDIAGIPYNGSGPAASAITLDKVVSREAMATWGIVAPRYAVVERPTRALAPAEVRRRREQAGLAYPLVVKPRASGCSLGVSRVDSDRETVAAVQAASRHSADVLLEEYVEGLEITVGVVGDELLAPLAIHATGDVYDPSAKWRHSQPDVEASYSAVPASYADQGVLEDIADRIRAALSLRNAWRFDAILREDGRVVVLEVNALPKLAAPYGEMAWAAGSRGCSHYDLLTWIASDALATPMAQSTL